MATFATTGNNSSMFKGAVLYHGNDGAAKVEQLREPLLDQNRDDQSERLREVYDVEEAVATLPAYDDKLSDSDNDDDAAPLDAWLKSFCVLAGCASSVLSESILSNTLWSTGEKSFRLSQKSMVTNHRLLFSLSWAVCTCMIIFVGMRLTTRFVRRWWFGNILGTIIPSTVVSVEVHYIVGSILASEAIWLWYAMALSC